MLITLFVSLKHMSQSTEGTRVPLAITQWSKLGFRNHAMIHQNRAHRPLCRHGGLQTNWLQVPDEPAKCLLLRRARLNQQAHCIVAVRIAPHQNGLKWLLWPQVLTKMWPQVAWCCHRTRCQEAVLVRTDPQLQILYLEGPVQHWLQP